MKSEEYIRKTEEFLKSKFDSGKYFSSHPEAKAYRVEHSYRVANIGREIAEKEGFDVTGMIVACLLGMSLKEKLGYVERRLLKIRELKNTPLATKTAEKMWGERISFQIDFFEKLYLQLKRSGGIV